MAAPTQTCGTWWCTALVALMASSAALGSPATSLQESAAVPEKVSRPSLWRGTQLERVVDDLRTQCSTDKDAVSCIKFKLLNILDQVFQNDNFQVTDSLSLVRNTFTASKDKTPEEGRSLEDASDALVSRVGRYLQEHDVTLDLPGDNQIRLSPRHLSDDRIDVSFILGQRGAAVEEGRGKGGKLKKMMVPILVFLLLKAMTLIPLAIGVLGLKAWNALQLSFFSFITSVALAVFQLCKKIAAESSSPPVAAHVSPPWEYGSHYAAARSSPQVNEDAQNIAYRAH